VRGKRGVSGKRGVARWKKEKEKSPTLPLFPERKKEGKGVRETRERGEKKGGKLKASSWRKDDLGGRKEKLLFPCRDKRKEKGGGMPSPAQ